MTLALDVMTGFPTARTGFEAGLAKHTRRIVDELGNRKAVILDIGCGTGEYIAKVTASNSKYWGIGIDVNPTFLRERRSNSADLVAGASEFLPFRRDSIDMVIMIESLEHVGDEEKTLKEISRASKSSGLIYASVPNRFYPLESHGIRIHNWTSERAFPIGVPLIPFIPRRFVRRLVRARTYTKRDICSLFAKQKWRVTKLLLMAPPIDRTMAASLTRTLRRVMRTVENTVVLDELSSSVVIVAEWNKT
jgi:ubiquinone/menaquinone biosynthesis C-methylase UbiE